MKLEAKFEKLGVGVTIPVECNREAYYGNAYDTVIERIARGLNMDYSHTEVLRYGDGDE